METNPISVSSTRKQISAALVKAQKAFGPALKSSQNPHFKSRYADLSACVEAVVQALNDNGIALTQRTELNNAQGVVVETVLIHESGEELSFGKLFVPCNKNDAQGYGSAITYARRYHLQTSLGLAPEDDDGNAASQPRIVSRDFATGKTTYAEKAKPWPRMTDEAPKSKAKPAPATVAEDDALPWE